MSLATAHEPPLAVDGSVGEQLASTKSSKPAGVTLGVGRSGVKNDLPLGSL